MNEIKAVVFDFGNTLVNAPPLGALLPKVLSDSNAELIGAEIDRTIDALYTPDQTVQPPWQEVWASAFAKFSVQYTERMALAHLQRFVDECTLHDQTHEMLSNLGEMQIQLALLSNVTGPSELFDEAMQRLQIAQYFESVHWSSATGLRKPSKEAYAQVLQKLNVTAKNALMVGDSELADIQGSKRMGMYAGLITHQGTLKTQADFVASPNDMAARVSSFVKR